jgi:hypothetical protein
MRYFDRRCARIVIHAEPPPESRAPARYPLERFPDKIVGRTLDPYLLGLWEAITRASDPFRAYIYSYQMLEYAAFYYLSEGLTQTVKRIPSAPEFSLQPEQSTRQILDALADFRSTDEEKIAVVVKQVSDPTALWREIQSNIDAFSVENSFEGEFSLPPLVKREWTIEDFRVSWHPNLTHSLRKLRNALVHGRESRTSKVVLPTRANYARVQPWRELLCTIAVQTIPYET